MDSMQPDLKTAPNISHVTTALNPTIAAQKEELDINLDKKRWKNRRRMAWVSLLSMIVLTYTLLFTDKIPIERLRILSDLITWYYFGCVSIVGAYMGVTTWAYKVKRGNMD